MLELSALHVSNKLPHIVTCQSGIDVSNYNHVITSLSTFFYCLSVASKVQCHKHQSTWLVQFPDSWLGVTNNSTITQHRRLQSWVGTRAKLGYAAFDVQLRKRIVTTLYSYTYVCMCVSMLMLVWGHAVHLRIRSLWYEYTMLRNNLGNAWACPGLQAPMLLSRHPHLARHVHSTCVGRWHTTFWIARWLWIV